MILRALSIRQPWPLAILQAGKDIENRPRRTNIRGRILIHASGTLPEWDYWADWSDIHKITTAFRNSPMPPPVDRYGIKGIDRGGIVGSVEIIDCVTESRSPWFSGPYGYVLKNPRPLKFWPCKGQLGFFTRDWPDYIRKEAA